MKGFADACNYVNRQVKPQITSKTTIQNMVYQDLRLLFGLSANLAVRACARVGANRKTAKQKNKQVFDFKPTSADYNARIFAFREKDWTASLTLSEGREHIRLDVGNYQRGKLKGRKPTSAQLCKHRDGFYYIHIQIKDEAPQPLKPTNVIGVDFGRRDIAVTSNGDKWDGKQINEVRDKYAKTRLLSSKELRKAQGLLAVVRDRFCNGLPVVREDFNNGSTIKSATELFNKPKTPHLLSLLKT